MKESLLLAGPSRTLRWIRAIVTVVSLLVGNAATGDAEDNLGNWLGFTSATRMSDQWSFFAQGELRTWEMASNLNETLVRFAGLYDFNPRHMAAFGYVRVDTWPFEENRGLRRFEENRFYQEYLFKHKLGKGNLNHRFRLEQRWLTVEGSTDLSHRARYMLKYTRPLNSETMKPGTWYIRVFDELFIDFDRNSYWFNPIPYDKGLNQNRLFFGGGRKLTAKTNFQIGLLWQHRPDNDFLRLVLSYSYNFDRRKDAM
jgi:hypothetical protein